MWQAQDSIHTLFNIIVDVLLWTLLLVCSRVNIVCDFGKTITFEMFFFRYLSPLNLKDKGMWSKLLLLAQLQCTVQFLPLCSFFLFLLSWDTFSLINWFSQKIIISPPILLFFQPVPSSHHPSPPPFREVQAKELLACQESLRHQYTCINLVLTLSNGVDTNTKCSAIETTYFFKCSCLLKKCRTNKGNQFAKLRAEC